MTCSRTRSMLPVLAVLTSITSATTAGASSTRPALLPATALAAVQSPPAAANQALRQLVAPMALLPDPLLAQIIAVANYPTQLHRAAQFQRDGISSSRLRSRSWPASVRTLLAVPELLQVLDDHRDWLRSVSQAYNRQQDAFMGAIQAIRHDAVKAGVLVSGPDIRVITAGDDVLIESERADAIPIPSYDPTTAGSGGLAIMGWLPTDAIVNNLTMDWSAGRVVHGRHRRAPQVEAGAASEGEEPGVVEGDGRPYTGSQGFDNRGNPIASGTYYVHRSRPGYDGAQWRPNGTVVMPGSVSTQGHALETATPLPRVMPTQPLMPAQPIAPVRPQTVHRPVQPRAPLEPISPRGPVTARRPVAPVPSNIPGVYRPLPYGAYGPASSTWGNTVFGWTGYPWAVGGGVR